MSLENAFGMPVLSNGSFNTRAGLFDSITVSPNASVWDFNIRPGAKWSDGTPITSSDINFTFGLESGYLLNTVDDFIGLGTEVNSVQVINSSMTQFDLSVPDATFGYVLSSQYYFTPVPEHVLAPMCESSSNPTACYDNQLNLGQDVTSGPFYHENYTAGNTTMILKANPYYWNGPNVSTIVVTFVPNNNETASLLSSDQSDLGIISPSSASSFSSNSNYGLSVEPDRGLLYMEYNVTEFPFNETNFRYALADSINTGAIASSIYDGYATPGYEGDGLIPPSATSWYNSSSAQYPYDFALALNNLTAAPGLSLVNGKLEYLNGTQVGFEIFTDVNNTGDLAAADMVKTDLSALGMNITVIPTSYAALDNDYSLFSSETGIRSEIVVASTMLPIFGLGDIDVLPAYFNYFPWSSSNIAQPNWILPQSADAEYYSLYSVVNSSTDQTHVQQSIRDIDGLNAQYLPLIALAYPDTMWVYRNTTFTGFLSANSYLGFDMGSYSIDPAIFAEIHCSSPTSCPTGITTVTQTTSSSTTTSGSTSSSSSSSTTGVPHAPSNDLLLVIAIIVIIAVIAAGTFLSRRRSRKTTTTT